MNGTDDPGMVELLAKVRSLEARLGELEGKMPDSSILSKSFWGRAWTVFGYYTATSLVLGLVLLVLGLLMGGMSGL